MGATRTSMSRTLLGLVTLVLAGCSSGADTPNPPAAPTTRSPSSSSPSATPDATDAATGWTGPVRTDAVLPVIARQRARSWTDPRDAASGGIDLRRIAGWGREYEGGAGGWELGLATRPPRPDTVGSVRRSIDYGVVVDADGDRDPDCHIGISDDARRPRGDQKGWKAVYRVWVTDLHADTTDDRVGPPYGFPVEFSHPSDRGSWRAMLFQFLGDRPEPCTPFGPRAAFYAYATLRDGGGVAAWDFAPDHAWLPMVPRHGRYVTRG